MQFNTVKQLGNREVLYLTRVSEDRHKFRNQIIVGGLFEEYLYYIL